MNEEFTLDDLPSLAESVDVECKAAKGRDGNGELPTISGKATARWLTATVT